MKQEAQQYLFIFEKEETFDRFFFAFDSFL